MSSTNGKSAAAAAQPELVELGRAVDRVRLEKDVKAVTRLRNPGSAGWRQVQALLAKRLVGLGFVLERHDYGTGTNLVGRLGGASKEQVIASAHYDHLTACAGADDNASGVAAALEAARLLASRSHTKSLVIAFWDEEERGLLGSRAFATRAREHGEAIAVALSFDAVAFASDGERSQGVPPGFERLLPAQAAQLAARSFRGDFIAVVGSTSARALTDRLAVYAPLFGLPLIRVDITPVEAALMPDLFRSDHASFWLSGYPALLLTDTAELRNPNYHCLRGADAPATLDYAFLTRVTGTAVAALADALQQP
ncbi:MAG: M20/M25/M40 family metallo-hydrolase [Polyangiaceae bacterium]